MNILTDDLKPTTIGEYIDSLIITNIRMWHKQELVYEIENLERMSLDEMFDFLKDSGWLNLVRNRMMEKVDENFGAKLNKKDNLVSGTNNIIEDISVPIWEEE